MSKLLWQPSEERKASTNIAKFMTFVNNRHGSDIATYDALHAYSVSEQEKFWADIWDFCGVKAEIRGERVLENGDKMPGARYFPDSRLNYAENMLQRRDDKVTLVFRGEDKVRREVTARELYDDVARMHAALAAFGLEAGDRVCGITPNMPETIVAFLGAVSLGGTWSSCSPDFGVQGVLDRFGQVEPRVLVVCDGYYYNGKTHNIADKVREIASQLPTLEQVVVIDYIGEAEAVAASIDKAVTMEAFLAPHAAGEIAFAQMPFDHPIYILFSSGTTGVPKCIVHTQGAALLKHMVEQTLHTDIKEDDKLFYFTTCGWMMWNWLVSALATGCTMLLYDGSPFYPDEKAIFDFADETGMTIFGTSAKYIDAVKKTGWEPKTTHSLETVRM
ncbi:MAG: AMP-binding protein, partial [Pseudomonadota bacterium]